MSTHVLAQQENNNFLLPNGTFFVELIIFGIVLLVIWRFVLPPVQEALKKRHDMVQRQIDESHQATEKFQAAEDRYREALTEARAESASIRDEARAEGQRMLDELRERTNAEVAEIRQRGEEQLAAQRERVTEELRPQLGALSTALASRVLGEDVSNGQPHQATIDRFLREQGVAEQGGGS